MSKIDNARSSDDEGNIERAYELYLEAISEGEVEMGDYLNASFIAFIFQDFGVSSAKKIPDSLIDEAWKKMYELLDMCESKFGRQKEIDFWRSYYRLILEGQEENNERCQRYLSSLNKINNPRTEKDRYINSVLESPSFQRAHGKSGSSGDRKFRGSSGDS